MATGPRARQWEGDAPLVARGLLAALEAEESSRRGSIARQTVVSLNRAWLADWGARRLYDPSRKAWVNSDPWISALLTFEARHVRDWVALHLTRSNGGLSRPTPPAVETRIEAHLAHLGLAWKRAWAVSPRSPHPWRRQMTALAPRRAQPLRWQANLDGVREVLTTDDLLAVAWVELYRLAEARAVAVRCADCRAWQFLPMPTPRRGRPRAVRCAKCEKALDRKKPRSKHPEYQRLLMSVRNARDAGRRREAKQAFDAWRREHGIA